MLRDASSATKSRGPARSPGTLWTTAEDLFGALHRRSDEPPGDIHGGAFPGPENSFPIDAAILRELEA